MGDGVESVLELLRDRGLRTTPQRRAIVEAVIRTSGHITPTRLARHVQARVPGVNASTVYRTLELLEDIGVLSHAHLESGPEYHRTSEGGHVHLTCSACGTEESLTVEETESLKELVVGRHGFHPDFTHFAISGRCRRCA